MGIINAWRRPHSPEGPAQLSTAGSWGGSPVAMRPAPWSHALAMCCGLTIPRRGQPPAPCWVPVFAGHYDQLPIRLFPLRVLVPAVLPVYLVSRTALCRLCRKGKASQEGPPLQSAATTIGPQQVALHRGLLTAAFPAQRGQNYGGPDHGTANGTANMRDTSKGTQAFNI